jgi:hypothetical protein
LLRFSLAELIVGGEICDLNLLHDPKMWVITRDVSIEPTAFATQSSRETRDGGSNLEPFSYSRAYRNRERTVA